MVGRMACCNRKPAGRRSADSTSLDAPPRGTAMIHAALREHAHRLGRGLSVEDGMIAAICATHNARLATRNVSDFDFLPVPLVNPWAVENRPS